MKAIGLTVILFCFVILTSCNAGTSSEDLHIDSGAIVEEEVEVEVEAFTRFDNDDFSVLYPGYLKLAKNVHSGHSMEVFDDGVTFASDDEDRKVKDLFTIIVKEYEKDAPSVDRLISYSIPEMHSLLNISVETEKNGYLFKTATTSGVRALEYYQEYEDIGRGETVVLYYLLVPIESRLYVLSYSCSKEVYESIKLSVVSKITESIQIKRMPITNWNIADPNIDTNGNESLAIKELTSFRSLNNGEKVSAKALFKAPEKYYGKAVTVKGKVEYVDSFKPIGGIRSEIVMETADGTLVDILGIHNAKDGLKVGHRTTLTGLPIGKGEVADAEGKMHTYVFLVAN